MNSYLSSVFLSLLHPIPHVDCHQHHVILFHSLFMFLTLKSTITKNIRDIQTGFNINTLHGVLSSYITFLPAHFNSVTWTYITPTERRWKIPLNTRRILFLQSQPLYYMYKEFCTLVILHRGIKSDTVL